MAGTMRKVITHKITSEGRDQGKLFQLTEMSSSKGEAWALRVFMGLLQGNVDIPPGLLNNLGMAALAEFGMRALTSLKWEILEPLLKEMFEGVQIIPDPKVLEVVRPLQGSMGDYDIEEVTTRVELRYQIWKLNMGFLKAALSFLQPHLEAAAGKYIRTKV